MSYNVAQLPEGRDLERQTFNNNKIMIEEINSNEPHKRAFLVGAVRRSFNWLSNLMTTQCPRCELGRVSHDHSEPHGWTTIEVYKCNRCNTEFV